MKQIMEFKSEKKIIVDVEKIAYNIYWDILLDEVQKQNEDYYMDEIEQLVIPDDLAKAVGEYLTNEEWLKSL